MNTEENYIEINLQSWNNRTDTHLKSEFYDLKNFINGKTSLNSIELDLLGDVTGKTILHLQCHFGQDSISLSRLGTAVTVVDLSDKAIESAKQIVKDSINCFLICCEFFKRQIACVSQNPVGGFEHILNKHSGVSPIHTQFQAGWRRGILA